MEALLLRDAAYVSERYEELQDSKRQLVQSNVAASTAASCAASTGSEASTDWLEQEHSRILQRAKTLEAKGPTPQLKKKMFVLEDVLRRLYAKDELDRHVISPPNGALKRQEPFDANCPVPLKELPQPTQVVLRMFFRMCRSLREPTKLAANYRLSVQIASKLPTILTTMPACVLSPGLADEASAELEDAGVCNVFYQLFQLFEELLGLSRMENVGGKSTSAAGVGLSGGDRATVIVSYVALSLKWGRLGYLLKGVKLLLENTNELSETRFEPLLLLLRELAATQIERPQIAFGEEEQLCGYLMSFGKGDHGKLGHGQCAHVGCQEGNCTENKMAPTLIAATRDVVFRKIDSLSTHSIAITANGEAMAWGNGDKYRLGHGSSAKEYTPRTIEFLSLKGQVCDLACGLGHTLALMESGELFAWGNGSNGRLGLGDANDRSSPTKVAIPTSSGKQEAGEKEVSSDPASASSTSSVRFRHIYCGASHSLGLSWDGRAYAWGKNNQGQCGHGHTNDQWTIQEIESFRGTEEGEEDECVTYAAGGWEHTLFCTASGRVYSCGCGYKDSRRTGIPPVLGHGDCDRRLKPTLLQTLDDSREEIVKVACGWDHSLAVSASGRVYTWGSGTNGKLGHGDEESFDIPTLVRTMEGKRVKDAKAGCEHTVFLTDDHELWTCGQGDSGRLGHGDSQTRKRPTKIELFAKSGLKPVALAVGDKYNLVLVTDDSSQGAHGNEHGSGSVSKVAYRVNEHGSGHGTNVHHGRHRSALHKKQIDNQQTQFGANWVLGIAAGSEPEGTPATRAANALKDGFTPDSARAVALFIAGHMDRLASDYVAEEPEPTSEKRHEPNVIETHSKMQSVLLPFAIDTSCESLNALHRLLRWVTMSTKTKDKSILAEKYGPDDLSVLATQERMGLALSCLRILQINLTNALRTPHVPGESACGTESHSKLGIDLFSRIHELLDSLAGLKEADLVYRFDDGVRQAGGANKLSAAAKAISQEAASALKMGFCMFYPTELSRCSLLWEILDDCKVDSPSMRTAILSGQLSKDAIMTAIFRILPSNGLLNMTDEVSGGWPNDGATGKDIFEIKTLMIVLLKRSSSEAIKHLDNEAFTDFTHKPDCFLQLLHVLQTHYFSIARRSALQSAIMSGELDAHEQIMDALLGYVDSLMVEALTVLKRLHKGSRQHEEIITWRLNGSFFHTVLPSAIECLSVLLLPSTNREDVHRSAQNLVLVERILPNLHVMLKMLDEVSWKMHSAGRVGNQTHNDRVPSTFRHVEPAGQEHNWFIDLGDACAVLCGKLSCELFYPSRMETQDITSRGTYCALVLSEGRLCREEYEAMPSLKDQQSIPVRRILEWEKLGVFEVEDELVGCEPDPSTSCSSDSSTADNRRFLVHFSEIDFSGKRISFWSWVAASLSYDVAISAEVQRLLTLVASVSSWHLRLVQELQHAYEIYDVSTKNSPPSDKLSPVPTSGIWGMLSTIVRTAQQPSWINTSLDLETMENAVKVSRLLLSLQPNPALMPHVLRSEADEIPTNSFRAWEDDSLAVLFVFLTNVVGVEAVQRSLAIKESDFSLVRTGICILHDLLRKLTTSSAKSYLLDEFVAVACTSSQMRAPTAAAVRRITLNQNDDKHINKAIENLFIRLARVISSDEASFELKKKSLLAWAVPLGTSKHGVASAVPLIVKSGIVSTLVELLLDEVNVPESSTDDKLLSHYLPSGSEPRMSTKLAAIKTRMFAQTPAQVIRVLAWEAFSAISLQLGRSEAFAEHREDLLLRSAGSDLNDREPMTPRSISLSPRRRLTLPKKTIVSTIDEIIEQMMDGLFLMLKGVKDRLEALDIAGKVKGEDDTNDTSALRGALTEEAVPQMRINDSVLFRLKQQYIAETACGQVLRLLCQLVGSSEQTSGESALARISFSDRWITLFTDMLQGTCRGQDVAQVYLCYLLQNVLPRAPPSPDLDIQALSRSLFSACTSCRRNASITELFEALNATYQTQHPSTLSVRRQNEKLCRILQQHGILGGKPCEESLAVSNDSSDETAVDKFTSKAKLSMKFAASVHLIQTLCSTPSWRNQMDPLITGSTAIFQLIGGSEEALQSGNSLMELADLRAVVSTVAGYSEETLNCHRVAVLDAAIFPLPLQNCSASFDSVIRLNESNADQAAHIQSLLTALMKEGSRQALYLAARKEILLKCHNDVVAVNAADLLTGSVIHLRSRVLRVVMTALIREQRAATSTMNKTWHRFLLANATTCDDLLRAAASSTKEDVTAMLGPDAKLAMRLRRVRKFVSEMFRRSKPRQSAQLTVTISELEILQWRLWEEMNTRLPSIRRIPWWQQSCESNEKLTLEVVGGDVEMCDFKVKALEHFPTVRLAQANVCANSGLWLFEVVILTDGLMQIGYVDGNFTADPLEGQGVGDHTNSWAFDGFRCKKWNVNSYDYGEQWKVDDVIGVLLDTDRMELSYFLNGKFLGVAFSSIPMTSSSQMCPAASLNVQQCAEFNFGLSSTPSTNEQGVQMLGSRGFKHLPVLSSEDQARLRPLLSAVLTRRSTKSDGGDAPDKEPKDSSENWESSSASDTEDGEIPLEDSSNISDFRRTIGPGSRDGRETRATDQNDEESSQRRRDLVEGLTGLGFPLEWATRCAAETRLPMDETGAVAWILEQMEKAGLNGAVNLPTISYTNADRMEQLSQPSALWNTRVQLPNRDASFSVDALETGLSLLADTGTSNPLERIGGNETTGVYDSQSGSALCPPSSSLSKKQSTISGLTNAFLEADKDDEQSNDAANEAFQAGVYRQRLRNFHDLLDHFDETATSATTRVLDRKPAVDDLVPLSIAIDTALYVAYSRQAFTSILLLALHQEKQAAVYQVVRRLVSSDEFSSRFRQFLRLVTGLDTIDAAFDMDSISGGFRPERPLSIQKAILALLQYEARDQLSADKCSLERPPLLEFLCQEMLSQCDQSLSFERKQNDKNTAESVSMPAWFAWVSGLVLAFTESRIPEFCRGLAICPFGSSSFLKNLMAIAASPSSAVKGWKYVALKLISRVFYMVRACEGCDIATPAADTPSALIVSTQLVNMTELFTVRHRREMFNRAFLSDTTSALFNLLLRSVESASCAVHTAKRLDSEKSCVNLRVNNYTSTQATISWDQASRAVSSVLEVAESGGISEDFDASTKTEIESSILLLQVKRCDPQLPGYSSGDSSDSTPKALPSKGTITIRNLLPDTQYRIRLAPALLQNDICGDAVITPPVDGELLEDGTIRVAEVIVQTPPEPVFELDRESMGKNLVVLNRNLSARNTVNKKWHSVRASVAFDEGVHQWQVRLDTCVSKNIFIGVCTAEASMENYVGSDAYGYGFLANRAVWHNKAKLHSYGEIFKQGDTIQVTLDCNAKTLAFSRNGEYLGIAASNMRAGVSRSGSGGSNDNCKWYPAFSTYNKDDKVTLIPPAAGSVFSLKEGRPQNASTFELIEGMQDVLAYDKQLSRVDFSRSQELYEKAFEAFDGWRRQEKIFREIALGHVVVIDTSKAATEKYGLTAGDSVFTSKGQCTVLGEYRHELWYEVDEGGSSSLFGASTPQLASWSLSTCHEILSSPDEYPVHRHHKYKLESESSTISESTNADIEQQNPSAEPETLGYQAFLDAQEHWGDNDVNASDLDAKLIAELDVIATSQACSSPLLLSFADVSTTLLLEKIYSVHGVSAERGSSQTLARIGLLLYVNQCLYNVVRVALPRITFATTLGSSEGLDIPAKQPSSTPKAVSLPNTECCQVSPVAALMNSPHWAIDDPSAFTRMPILAARLLFSSQKEKLIDEELRRTKTASPASDGFPEPSDNEDGGSENDIPAIKLVYPPTRAVPFWELSPKTRQKPRCRLPTLPEASVFVQLAKQLAAQDARQWRRASSQPFEAIPISQAFRVHVETPSTEACGNVGEEPGLEGKAQQQQDEDDDEQELQQPSSKQTSRYLNLFESAVRELQSPCFPLFAPVETPQAHGQLPDDTPRRALELDVNLELFSPSALAHSRLRAPQLMLWYFCLGQLLGIAWRSKVLLPLQYVSKAFWEELVSPADAETSGVGERCETRDGAIRAVRDGLFSIIPSRCVALLSRSNPSLRERLSDLDVGYVASLERHATYTVPGQSHHDVFWQVLHAFTSVERRMLEQFINPERRTGPRQVEVPTTPGATSSIFVLQVAEALADGRDQPDSCYPVVVPIGPHASRLHLPAYSSAQTLRQKLLLAMTNIPFM